MILCALPFSEGEKNFLMNTNTSAEFKPKNLIRHHPSHCAQQPNHITQHTSGITNSPTQTPKPQPSSQQLTASNAQQHTTNSHHRTSPSNAHNEHNINTERIEHHRRHRQSQQLRFLLQAVLEHIDFIQPSFDFPVHPFLNRPLFQLFFDHGRILNRST